VAPQRSAKAVLQNIKLQGQEDGTISLSATDMEIGLTYNMDVENLTDPDCVLLPAARLSGLIRDDWSETVNFVIENQKAEISTKHGKFHLMGSDDSEFPEIPGLGEAEFVEINGDEIVDAVAKTMFAAARSDVRYALNGILISADKDNMDFVASDTHRLSLVKKKIRNSKEIKADAIVIPKGMSTLARLSEGQEGVKIRITPREMIAQTACATLVARLVEGQFPRYKDVIPKDFDKTVTIDRETLAKSLRLAGQVANEETRSLTLSASGGKVTASATGNDAGDAQVEMEAQIEGGDVSISFNFVYLLDVIKVLDGKSITLQLKDRDTPARLDAGDFTHVIMPIKPVKR
jgi:DNA polymerase-3 subunit beta